jgi:hypothetical protein
MADSSYFYSLLVEINKKNYIKLEDHDYIKNFVTTAKPCPIKAHNFFSLYCKYILKTNYYDPNMFNYFRLLLNEEFSHHLECIIKCCQIDIISTYLEVFSAKLDHKINPYSTSNSNITLFIVSNYKNIVDYDKLYDDIIFHGDFKMYNIYKHNIERFIISPTYEFTTKSIDMFKFFCQNFPYHLYSMDLHNLPHDDYVIEKLLEIGILANKPELYKKLYDEYPNYGNQIFELAIKCNFAELFRYTYYLNFDEANIYYTAMIYILSEASLEKSIQYINLINIYEDISHLYDLISSSSMDVTKISTLQNIIYTNINIYSIGQLFSKVNWKILKPSVYMDIFMERVKHYNNKDWIELIYSKLRYRLVHNLCDYYINFASEDVKTIIESIFRASPLESLLQIIAHTELGDNNIICKIAETKFDFAVDNAQNLSLFRWWLTHDIS